MEAVERLELTSAAPRLRPLVTDRLNPPPLRLRALQALAELRPPGLAALTRQAGTDPDERVRLGAAPDRPARSTPKPRRRACVR